MKKKWLTPLLLICVGLAIESCSEYNKVLKSTDIEYKFAKANEYYDKKDYYKAYPLIEDLSALYRGQKRSEGLFYKLAYCDFYQGDFLLSSHRFTEYTKTFPTSSHTEECVFLSAYSLYMLSPKVKLDQSNTYKAISSLQGFIDRYPRSSRVDSSNTLIIELEHKIEDKVLKSADQYKLMEYYTSAILTYENMLKDFPDTRYRETIFYSIFESYYLLAIKSVEVKKSARIDNALKAYIKFAQRFPLSIQIDNAEEMYTRLEYLKFELEN